MQSAIAAEIASKLRAWKSVSYCIMNAINCLLI